MVRPRLLVISLAVALVASFGVGCTISRSDSSSDDVIHIGRTDDSGPDATDDLRPPTIGTNAVVKGKPLPDVAVSTLAGDSVNMRSLTGTPMEPSRTQRRT